jgi:hypothetical protein
MHGADGARLRRASGKALTARGWLRRSSPALSRVMLIPIDVARSRYYGHFATQTKHARGRVRTGKGPVRNWGFR